MAYDKTQHTVIEGVIVEAGCSQEFYEDPGEFILVTSAFLDFAIPEAIHLKGRELRIEGELVELIKYDPDEGMYLGRQKVK